MSPRNEHDEDFFAESRMSFGDHLDELRTRLLRSIKAVFVFVLASFLLDSAGQSLGLPWLGIGKPVLDFITEPVKSQVKEFYRKRTEQAKERLLASDEGSELRRTQEMPVEIDTKVFLDTFEGLKLRDSAPEKINVTLHVIPGYFEILQRVGENVLDTRQYLTVLSATEGFMVWMKVTLICGFIIACPIVFYQLWAFVAAGLYPHEKKYVYTYLPFTITLFIVGILICELLVLPAALKFLLNINLWLGFDPDLRLADWLNLALILPMVFGVSFQTPLVMLMLSRIGVFTWEQYRSKWRYALMAIAMFSAIATPTPDAITMLYLFIPMFGLYCLGVLLCWWIPTKVKFDSEERDGLIGV
jgi:sec-independent protein translocase protein TatC